MITNKYSQLIMLNLLGFCFAFLVAHLGPQYLKLYCVKLYLKLSRKIEQLEKKSGYGLFCSLYALFDN